MHKETGMKSRGADTTEINVFTWKPLKAIILLELNPWISIFIGKTSKSTNKDEKLGSLRRTAHHKHQWKKYASEPAPPSQH